MMTILLEDKLDEYYRTGEYKGFYEVIEHDRGNMTHLTLSDGVQEISASGMFKSDALQRIFHQIDSVRSN
ncbi:hypothetical protein [Fodinibius sp. Rm-B-1B1-1]|uniref:hypothetical protein n=1 Tax=Fodinibius alkaliphilus TaxID=3140241 RepID=UPI00315A9A10